MAAERPARSAPRRGAAAYGVAYMASENPISKENNTLWQHTTEHTHVTEEGVAGPPLRGEADSAGALRAHLPAGAEREQRSDAPHGKKAENSEREKMKREKQKKCSTRPSRVVPHRSTARARPRLTSLFGWEAVSRGDMAALARHRHCNS